METRREFWHWWRDDRQRWRWVDDCRSAAPWERATVYLVGAFGDVGVLRLVVEVPA